MKGKRIYLSLFFLLLFASFLLCFPPLSEWLGRNHGLKISVGTVWAQGLKGEGAESTYVQMLKQLRATVDDWLKDINDRIESEDVTGFEVRFLEIVKGGLEWVREKIDAQIQSEERKLRPKRKAREI